MAWKEIDKSEFSAPAFVFYGGKAWVFGDGDKRMRITFEEEVKECCETWRNNRFIETCDRDGFITTYNILRKPKFCPECGEKL